MVSLGATYIEESQHCHGSPSDQMPPSAAASEEQEYEDTEEDIGMLREELLEKEKNLMLAAQFGKSLLERNNELTAQIQADRDSYEAIIEELKEGNHELKLQLDRTETNFELRLASLEGELASSRSVNDRLQQINEDLANEKSRLLHEISNQHSKFASTLSSASSVEDDLREELARAREAISKEMTHQQQANEHVMRLQHEISGLTDRLAEHSKKSRAAESDRLQLSQLVDSLTSQVQMLESENSSLRNRINELEVEIGDVSEKLELANGTRGMPIKSGYMTPQCDSNFGSFEGSLILSPSNGFGASDYPDSDGVNKNNWLKESEGFGQFSLEDDEGVNLSAPEMEALRRANEDIIQISQIISSLCNRQSCQSQSTPNSVHLTLSPPNSSQSGRSSDRSSSDLSFHSPTTFTETPANVQRLSRHKSPIRPMHRFQSPSSISSPEKSRRFQSPAKSPLRSGSRYLSPISSPGHARLSRFKSPIRTLELELDLSSPCSPQKENISITALADRISDFKRFVNQLHNNPSISLSVPAFDNKLKDLKSLVAGYPPAADGGNTGELEELREKVRQMEEEKERAIEKQTEAEVELAKERVKCKEVQEELLETVHSKLSLSQQLENLQFNDFGPSPVPMSPTRPSKASPKSSPARSAISRVTSFSGSFTDSSSEYASPRDSPSRKPSAPNVATGITRRFSFFR